MDLLGGITSLLGGGLTGILGSTVQRVFEYKSKKLDIELQKDKFVNEVALKKVDAEIMAQEWASRTRVAEVEGASRVEVEDARAFNTALTSEPQRYSQGDLTRPQNWLMVSLDFFRGIVRPGLTLYLCSITTVVYIQAREVMGSNISSNQAYDLVDTIVHTVLYLTATCVLFWFGSRDKGRAVTKIK